VLSDFGLAKLMPTHLRWSIPQEGSLHPSTSLQIWLNQPAKPSTDQYALALCVHEALTGTVLFSATRPGDHEPPFRQRGAAATGAEMCSLRGLEYLARRWSRSSRPLQC